jgi:hypothetical protein
MRRRALAAVVLALATSAGCAAIEGLDGITEQACAPDCGDAGPDATTPVTGPDGTAPGNDSPAGEDSPSGTDTTVTPDGSGSDDSPSGSDTSTNDAGTDSGAPDSGTDSSKPGDAAPDSSEPDSGTDSSAADTGTDAPPPDAGSPDTGCGPLTAIDNCSACGDTCTATNATSPMCSGTTCSYTCNTGYLDCNLSVAPDLDGCECNVTGVTTAPSCCGSGCPIEHNYDEDITSAHFYDCVAAGTYNVTLAMDACTAFTGNASQCQSGYYCPEFPDGGGDLGDQVCAITATTCQCWSYNGSLVGLVSPSSGNPSQCYCPQTGSSAIHWD